MMPTKGERRERRRLKRRRHKMSGRSVLVLWRIMMERLGRNGRKGNR